MAKANAEATAERVDHLQGMILAGEPNTACLTYARQTWGCSRRNARRVVSDAHKEWMDVAFGDDKIDQRDLLFQSVARLERTARKAEESGQFGVVVGCVAQLNKMMALGADQKGFRGHPTHYYRR